MLSLRGRRERNEAATAEPAVAPTIVLHPSGLALRARAGEALLDSALAAGLAFPHDCRAGNCASCKCRLRAGRVRALADASYALSPDEIAAGYVLACQSVPLGDVEIEIALDAPDPATTTTSARIVAQTPLTHDIVELVVEADAPVRYDAGQSAYLGVPALGVERPYSFARAPRGAAHRHLHFHVRRVAGGVFSEWLHGADRSGERLTLRGPHGAFRLHRGDAGTLVCVAGGSGLAPILAMLDEAQWAGDTRAVTLLFGARARRDLYELAEIDALRARWPSHFAFVPVLSQAAADDGWDGAHGAVGERLAALPDLADATLYLCGPPPMVDHCVARLADAGVADGRVFVDKFLDRATA